MSKKKSMFTVSSLLHYEGGVIVNMYSKSQNMKLGRMKDLNKEFPHACLPSESRWLLVNSCVLEHLK